MNREDIDIILSGNSKEVLDAFAEITSIQKREVAPIKTGIKDLDHFLITGLNNMMVFVGARPSMGKTHMANIIKDNLLDKKLNPSVDISILNLNWEMQTKSSILRHLKRKLNRSMRDILSREFTEEEKAEVELAMEPLLDERVTSFNHVVEGDSFEYLVRQHMSMNPGKEVVLMVDHIHILMEKKQIDSFLFLCNKLKKEFTNLSFVIFFQLNRELEKRWRGGADAKMKLNPKNFLPNSGDIYNTDSLQQFADVIVTLVIPQVVDMDEYTTVNKDRNKHLEEHYIKGASSDNTTAKLKGRNRVYRNYIKIRLNDNFEDPRIYCDVINPELEDSLEERYYTNINPVKEKPTFPSNDGKAPTVDMTVSFDTRGSLNNSAAKGEGFESESSNKKKPF